MTKLTEGLIERTPFAKDARTVLLRDATLPGFMCVVGRTTKSYVVQAEYWRDGTRKTFRRTIGKMPDISLKDARVEAARLIAEIKNGIVSDREAPQDADDTETFGRAVADFIKSRETKGRRQTTIKEYRQDMAKWVGDWFDRPLASITKTECRERHQAIIDAGRTKDRADAVFRGVRAVFNHVIRTTDIELPKGNPTFAVEFTQGKRKQDALAVGSDINEFWRHVRLLKDPVRRELWTMIALSGYRPGALCNARWDDLDRQRQCLTLRADTTKTGRAFELPLSRQMMESIDRLAAQGGPYLFGGIKWRSDDIVMDGKRVRASDLRRTYKTASIVVGLDDTTSKLLMQHAVAGVAGGYISRSTLWPFLLEAQQKMSDALMP